MGVYATGPRVGARRIGSRFQSANLRGTHLFRMEAGVLLQRVQGWESVLLLSRALLAFLALVLLAGG